ncbi:MAG: PIN domain-containing protein [Candidatus Lokiarchaeota archaeon]|nr:PIN domain-containing protein [Candidatus Lokiarchaeota archaeon]
MTVLIDSNVMIDFLKGNKNAIEHIKNIISGNVPIFISIISIYEIYIGIIANLYSKAGRPSKVPELLNYYEKFLIKCGILDFTRESVEKAADIFIQSQGKGLSVKKKDCQIAGIALINGISEVLTRDKEDFLKIFNLTGLKFKSY